MTPFISVFGSAGIFLGRTTCDAIAPSPHDGADRPVSERFALLGRSRARKTMRPPRLRGLLSRHV
jgi:hypothetical protein